VRRTHLIAISVAHAGHHPISMFQAVVLGVLQGLSELFPVSSLGHTVLFPTLFGWHSVVTAQSDTNSFWLAFVVMLHVGSAIGLLIYFWREPTAAAFFLILNGFILLSAERLRRRADARVLAAREGAKSDGGRKLETLDYKEAGVIGVAQSSALIAGISRDGVCMTAGLVRGLDHEDSARFAFLLATPVILAAGLFKLSDITGHLGDGVRTQALVAALCAAVTSIVTVRFLVGYFKTRTLTPFGIYCLLFGAGMAVYTIVH
jgi:undecaprenyl-diphosphatase